MVFINQMEPWFDEKEAQAVLDYMRSGGWVTEFSRTREFEDVIARYTGARHCSVVCNGTVSLMLALASCGVGPGDQVIVPDFTMVATANAAKLAGADVVFVDIRPDNLCMDFEEMKRAITPSTKAVMLVSINGRCPENLEEFVAFCGERGLWLIEDAAQSLGSFKDGRHLGTFGHIGSFSFSAPKVITTGQGGALVTDDDELIDRIRRLRDFGRARGGCDEYLTMGWNFKFTDLQAVIGIAQMKKLRQRVERKKEIYARYTELLADVPGLSFLPTNLENTSPWFIDVLVGDGLREGLIAHLKRHNIGSRAFYPALHSQPVYGRTGTFPITERIAREGLWLPSSAKLTDEQVRYVCRQVRAYSGE